MAHPVRSPESEAGDAKVWSTLRAKACLHGLLAFRSDPADGTPVYFTVAHGTPPRVHLDLASVRSRIEDIEAGEL